MHKFGNPHATVAALAEKWKSFTKCMAIILSGGQMSDE